MDNERRYFPSRAMITEPSSPLGDIKINFEVIANIVRLTVTEIEGVLQVGGNWLRHVETVFSRRRDVIDGVYIEEDGDGYAIKVRVQVAFGVELTKVAYQIQNRVHENLQTMANVNVNRIDVMIDGIHRVPASEPLTSNRE
jgi:uncharacterized alkaline shock family protein YloU